MDQVTEERIRNAATGALPRAPDGPIVRTFSAGAVARAIELELARARAMGWSKISVHMDLDDAAKLAQVLRRRG